MQLRDYNPGIPYPGQWGFFGGSIEKGEVPEQTARRELFEEIGYSAKALNKLDTDRFYGSDNIVIYSFSCFLATSIKTLSLTEGLDLGLFTQDEIKSKRLYSCKMNKVFPVIPHIYIENTIGKLAKSINSECELSSAIGPKI